MKNHILLFLLSSVVAFAADIKVRDLSITTVLPATNDYIMVDGITNGTTKNLLSNVTLKTNTRASLAGLSVAGVGTGTAVNVLSATTLGDNGGGLYFYNSSSTATPDGINVIQPVIGSGRWIISRNAFAPLPTVSTVGGVFATAAQPGKFVNSVQPTGQVTLGTVTAADVTGLGSMASQNNSAVTITGGTISGTAFSGASVAATTISASGQITSTVATGTPPLAVTSTTLVPNLYAARSAVADTVSTIPNLTGNVTSVGTVTTIAPNAVTNGMLAGAIDAGTKLSGTLAPAQFPAFSGDVTNVAGTTAMTVQRINGVALGNLATGILKNTAVTGVPSIAVPADFPTLNQSTTGNAGSATRLQTARNINGVPFDGTQDITIAGGGGTSNANALTGTTLAANVVNSSLTSVGPLTALSVGAITSTSLSAQRTTKQNLNMIVNVKDYGATGNGSTDDQAAIQSAISALTNNSTLYFPPGKYRFTGPGWQLSNLTNVSITGEGAELFNDTPGSNTFDVQPTCSAIYIHGMRFVGTAPARANGIHIRMGASNSVIRDNYLERCSDFAILISSGPIATPATNVLVANNIIYRPLGDGVHVGHATNVSIVGNVITETGDDGIGIIADYPGFNGNRVTVVGNNITRAGFGPGGVSGVGIRVEEATDVLLSSNSIYQPFQSGIDVSRWQSRTAYNDRIDIVSNKIYGGSAGIGGALGTIIVEHASTVTISNNEIIDTNYGSGIAYLDTGVLHISGNHIRKCTSRGIMSIDTIQDSVNAGSFVPGTTYFILTPADTNFTLIGAPNNTPGTQFVATGPGTGSGKATLEKYNLNWQNISITGNYIDWVQANETINLIPPEGMNIDTFIVSGNTGTVLPTGPLWINFARASNGRIFNNTTTSAVAVAPASGSVTVGNNN